MPPRTKTKTKTKIKKPAGPLPDASLLGIPPEMRNAIYRLVADDIDEVSIIGRKLNSSKASSSDHTWLWNTIAKHPLSQTCRQLRQEFDPVHRRRALTTGVTKYRLELADFDVDRIKTFAEVIPSMPNAIQGRLMQDVRDSGSIIRFNLTYEIFDSIRKLEKNWRALGSIFSGLRRALNLLGYGLRYSCSLNLNLNHRTMSSAQKKTKPTRFQVREAKKDLKNISDTVWTGFQISRESEEGKESVRMLDRFSSELEYTHDNYFRHMRRARKEKANKALEDRLEAKLRLKLRDELKAELKAELREEIVNEQKEEAMTELEQQIQEGLEGWGTNDVPEI